MERELCGRAGEAAPPLSKKKQKKQAKRVWNAQKKAEKKIAKKESAKVQSAKRKAQIDEALDNMTPEEREAHRQKAFAKFQVALISIDNTYVCLHFIITRPAQFGTLATQCDSRVGLQHLHKGR